MAETKEDLKKVTQKRRHMGPPGMMPGEKAKDFKGSIKNLIKYMGNDKIKVLVVMICAAISTVFVVVGPKIMGKATTELARGLMKKISQTGEIDFDYIAKILLITLGLYVCSSIFTFIQGYIMSGVTQRLCYRMRKELSERPA